MKYPVFTDLNIIVEWLTGLQTALQKATNDAHRRVVPLSDSTIQNLRNMEQTGKESRTHLYLYKRESSLIAFLVQRLCYSLTCIVKILYLWFAYQNNAEAALKMHFDEFQDDSLFRTFHLGTSAASRPLSDQAHLSWKPSAALKIFEALAKLTSDREILRGLNAYFQKFKMALSKIE